jgi:uncharacterized protein (TIGR02271 family)
MSKNTSVGRQRTYILMGIISGTIVGGLIGITVGFVHGTGTLIIPGFSHIFSVIPLDEILSGTILGIIVGGLIGGTFTLYSTENRTAEYVRKINTTKQNVTEDSKNITLQIKEEQLDIAKMWIQTADVQIYREIFTENKSFTVPVKREELVIEKKALDPSIQEHKDAPTEVIRIPLSEEQVELIKHRVALEDVSIYKEQIDDIKHIEAILKKEQPDIKVSGSPKVIDKSDSKNS